MNNVTKKSSLLFAGIIRYDTEAGKVLLCAITMKMHRLGSKLVNKLLLHVQISLPSLFLKKELDTKNWEDTVKLITASSPITVKTQVRDYIIKSVYGRFAGQS